MAFYTIKSRNETLLPLANYTGNNTWVRSQMASLGYGPTASETQLMNAIGREAGAVAQDNTGQNDNFFVKKAKSLGNTFGTVAAVPVSFAKDRIENDDTERERKNSRRSMNDIAKGFGYDSWNDWQDAYEEARNSGDTAKIKEFETQNKKFQDQASQNVSKMNERANAYKDYRENNFLSKELINQDNGKFAGSAINTLNTMADVMLPGAGVAFNAVQGAAGGLADELEANGGTLDITRRNLQNGGDILKGWDNFSGERAGQNALIGATTGAVTGAFNKGISNALAPKGAVKEATKGGFGTAVKNGLKAVGTGAARGALSGAVGGATGAGMQSALNNVEFGQGVQNALQGAWQGAKQGAIAGGVMGGANAAFSKTNIGRQLQEAGENWKKSGSNFNERLTNTLNSGDSAVGDWLNNRRQSNVLGSVGNLGNRVADTTLNQRIIGAMDEAASIEDETITNPRTAREYEQMQKGTSVLSQERQQLAGYQALAQDLVDKLGADANSSNFAALRNLAEKGSYNPTAAASLLASEAVRLSMLDGGERFVDDIRAGMNLVAQNSGTDLGTVLDQVAQWDRTPTSAPAYREGADEARASRIRGILQENTPTTAAGWAKKAGQRIVEDVNNSNLGNRVKDVSSDMSEDIRNMQIRDYNAYADGGVDTTYGIASDPRVRQRLLANVNAQLAENPNARIGDTNFDADAIISEYSERLTPEQYRNFNPADAENVLIQELQGLEASQGFTRPNSRQITQNTQVDPWDRVAQEAGYSNYDEVLQRYAEANPNVEINPRGMAGQVLTWMDQNPNTDTPTTAAGWAKQVGQRALEDINNSNLGLRIKDVSADDPSKQLYNALAGNQEPTTTTETETFTEENVVPSRTSKEGKLRYARGKELLRQYGTVDQPMARASRAVESVQEIADAGFTKPEDVERMANIITGSNGEVSKLTRNLIKNAAPVDTFAGNNGQTIEEFIDNSIELNSLYGTNKGNAVKQTIEANLRSLPSRAEGSVTYTDAPEDVFKVVQNLEASAAELEGRGGSRYFRPTIENINQARVLKDTASLLKQRLFDGADVQQALTPEVAQNLKSYDPKNKKYADWVDNTIMKAETINDLRAAQAPFVRMSKYIDNAYTQAATVGGRMAENASDLSRILTTRNGLLRAGIDAVWNSNAARRGRAAVYDKMADKAAGAPTTAKGWAKQAGQRAVEDLGNTNLGNRIQDVNGGAVSPRTSSTTKLASSTTGYDPSTQLYNAIGRAEGLSNAKQARGDYLVDAIQEAEVIPNAANTLSTLSTTPTATTDSGSTSLYSSLYGTPTTTATQQGTTNAVTNTGYFQPTGDYWTDIIASAMSSAIDSDDVESFATLYGMYQNAIANLNKTSSEKDYSNPVNWTSSDRSKLISAQNGLDQINQLEEAYTQATGEGGSNAIQGFLRSRAADISGGNWDPSAANYNSLADSVGMGIIKNLVNLGVTESDAERYKKYLPSLTDTKEQAKQKLETLRSIYQSQINNLYSAYGV